MRSRLSSSGLQSFAHAIAALTDLIAGRAIWRKFEILIEILHHDGKPLLLDVSVGENEIDVGIIGLRVFGLQGAGFGFGTAFESHQGFGLRSEVTMRKVGIQWPSGRTEELKNVAADAIYTIVEGKGIQNAIKLAPAVDATTFKHPHGR